MARIVIKIGSAILAQDNNLNIDRLTKIVSLVSTLKKQGDEIILVSSGAVSAGYTIVQLDRSIISCKQALASIGQPLLMHNYALQFKAHDIVCSQVLLEASIFNDKNRLSHAKDAINELLRNNIVPIVNENDVTAIDELVFGDNDQLSAHITYNFECDLLVILTDIDGYYDDDPHLNTKANIYKTVNCIDKNALNMPYNANNKFATGGITTKLKAVDFLLKNNVPTFLASGLDLEDATVFLTKNKHNGGTLFISKDIS